MRRRTALLAATVVVSAIASAAPAAPGPPSRAQVSADEFDLTLSRTTIHGGSAIIELVNYGEDDHDLALHRAGGSRVYRIGIVHPGETGELEARLRPGRFVLWCTLPGHRARGMRATLRVT
jgi:hypothetical protein